MPDRISEPIVFIDRAPTVAIDGEGVGLVIASGECVWRRRMARGLWRSFLENEIRRLNQWELVERATMGRVLPFKSG